MGDTGFLRVFVGRSRARSSNSLIFSLISLIKRFIFCGPSNHGPIRLAPACPTLAKMTQTWPCHPLAIPTYTAFVRLKVKQLSVRFLENVGLVEGISRKAAWNTRRVQRQKVTTVETMVLRRHLVSRMAGAMPVVTRDPFVAPEPRP